MPNPLFSYFQLTPPSFSGVGNRPSVNPPEWTQPAIPGMFSDIAGTLTIVEPIFSEKKKSGKFQIGKHGVTADREFVVPWINSIDGTKWWQYAAQLLGDTKLVSNGAGGVSIIATRPLPYHADFPWLLAHEVTCEGEDEQGPDTTGKMMYRRAILKVKYQPLDYNEELDQSVQFQSIPGHRWVWIGQDARRSYPERQLTLTLDWNRVAPRQRDPGDIINFGQPRDLVVGDLALDIVTTNPVGGSTNFALVRNFLSVDSQLVLELLPRLNAAAQIARGHDTTVGFVDPLNNAIRILQGYLQTASVQVTFVSQGTFAGDSPRMAAMLETMNNLAAGVTACQAQVFLIQSELAPFPAELAQITSTMDAINQTLNGTSPALIVDIATSTDLTLNAAFPDPVTTTATVNIRIDTTVPNDTTAEWQPGAIQQAIERVTFVGAVTVTWAHPERLSYNIQIFSPNITIRINNRLTGLQAAQRLPPVEMDPQFDWVGAVGGAARYTGHYRLLYNRPRRGLAINYLVAADPGFQSAPVLYEPDAADLFAGGGGNETQHVARVTPLVLRAFASLRQDNITATVVRDRVIDIFVPSHAGLAAQWAGSPFAVDATGQITGGLNPTINPPLRIRFAIDPQQNVDVRLVESAAPQLPLLRGDTLAGRFISNGKYKIEKHQVLAVAMPLLMSLNGTVNSQTFRGFPPWTLLIHSIKAKKTSLMNGTPCWTMDFSFNFNPNTWNAVYRGETNQYEFVRAQGQTQPNPILNNVQSLTLLDGTQVPILTRGRGIAADVPLVGSLNVQATDVGLLYPIANFAIIDSFF